MVSTFAGSSVTILSFHAFNVERDLAICVDHAWQAVAGSGKVLPKPPIAQHPDYAIDHWRAV